MLLKLFRALMCTSWQNLYDITQQKLISNIHVVCKLGSSPGVCLRSGTRDIFHLSTGLAPLLLRSARSSDISSVSSKVRCEKRESRGMHALKCYSENRHPPQQIISIIKTIWVSDVLVTPWLLNSQRSSMILAGSIPGHPIWLSWLRWFRRHPSIRSLGCLLGQLLQHKKKTWANKNTAPDMQQMWSVSSIGFPPRE